MALKTEVLLRHGGATSQRLIELTNIDSTALTINNNVLDAACDDAEGIFQDITGITPVISQKNHLYMLIQGVLAFLEQYKNRDSNIMTQRWKNLIGSLMGFRKRAYIDVQTNSLLKIKKEKNVLSDMDRSKRVWDNTKQVSSIEEYNE